MSVVHSSFCYVYLQSVTYFHRRGESLGECAGQAQAEQQTGHQAAAAGRDSGNKAAGPNSQSWFNIFWAEILSGGGGRGAGRGAFCSSPLSVVFSLN